MKRVASTVKPLVMKAAPGINRSQIFYWLKCPEAMIGMSLDNLPLVDG
jgi:hypothetical protein